MREGPVGTFAIGPRIVNIRVNLMLQNNKPPGVESTGRFYLLLITL